MKKPRRNVKSLLAIGAFIGIINNQTISEAMVRSILGVEPSTYMETIDAQRESRGQSITDALRPVSYEGADRITEQLDTPPEQTNETLPEKSEQADKGTEVQVVNDVERPADDGQTDEEETESGTDETEDQETEDVPSTPEPSEGDQQPNQPDGPETNEQETNDTSSNNSGNNQSNGNQTNQDKDKDPDPITEEPESPIDEEERESNFQFSVTRNLTTQQFINEIGSDAQDVAYNNDLYASVMIAQAILETGSGNSALSSPPNHNLFGIKGSFRGQKVTFNTQEDDGSGAWYTISSNFRKYPSYRESIEDYARLLREGITGNPRFYAPVWKENAPTYREATAWLTGRYATDIHYDQKLNALIEAYDLTIYDNEPTEEVLEEIERTRAQAIEAARKEEAKTTRSLFEDLQRSSANRRGSGNLPASIRTVKDRLQENANANTYANQLRGMERAGSEVDANE
ncbi:glucosaminidase domain-containing protein [Enterococcus casseliflavus]|uniref:glucosaminidase domain-containing protein n=1 Tax=Enterococcus casseliflavus TaxID=37734 RepID=UPI0039A52375